MIRNFLFLFSALFALQSCAQKDNEKQKTITDRLVDHYNNKSYDSIFHLFSTEMQEALPLDKTVQFFKDIQSGAGKILKYEFKKTQETYSQYKAQFEKAVYKLSISEDGSGKINGLFVAPYTEEPVKEAMARNISKLSLPFTGEWFVLWGGDKKEQNYHVINKAQKNAFDIVMVDEKGKSYKTNGATNEDYYAFGQPLLAPCDAEVVLAVDGVKDNVPAAMNKVFITGNTVILKTSNNEYLLFAHFKQYSIKVKQGDKVKKGQLLGLCGNSGNSSEPHLHFHIQDEEDMTEATGIKCYFEKLVVNGTEKTDHSPVKGERIKNAE